MQQLAAVLPLALQYFAYYYPPCNYCLLFRCLLILFRGLVGWLVGWLIGWLIRWLLCCLDRGFLVLFWEVVLLGLYWLSCCCLKVVVF